MIEPRRRGWCPTLEAPMATGDGLLARLYPRYGLLTPKALADLAVATQTYGNGLIEITSRGNIQVRGLREDTVTPFGEAVVAAGIAVEPAPELRIPPFAARSVHCGVLVETAEALRSALSRQELDTRLSPKFAIVVTSTDDGLAGLPADLRLIFDPRTATFDLSVAGDAQTAVSLGTGDRPTIVAKAIDACEAVASLGERGRARHLQPEMLRELGRGLRFSDKRIKATPVRVGLHEQDGETRLGLALALGQIEARQLADFCAQLPVSATLCLAPDRMLAIAGLAAKDAERVASAAGRFGLITAEGDPRLAVFACAGAPACAAAHFATRSLGSRLAPELDDLLQEVPLYIAGCPKQCARPSSAHIAITGTSGGLEIEADDAKSRDLTRLRQLIETRMFA